MIEDFIKPGSAPEEPKQHAPQTGGDITQFMSQRHPQQDSIDAERSLMSGIVRPGRVTAWSFSTLTTFEKCPYAVWLAKVEKIKQESGPAAERGTEIHDAAEAYIRGNVDELHPALQVHMQKTCDDLRARFQSHPHEFSLEDNWGFTDTWDETGFFDKDVWARFKLDVFWRQDATCAQIDDWKSGRKFGNEMKHGDQGMQYAIAAFTKFPELQFIETNFLYLDQPPGETGRDNILHKTYNRGTALAFRPRLEQRAFALTRADDATLKTPKPSVQNCRFCYYNKSGDCRFAQNA